VGPVTARPSPLDTVLDGCGCSGTDKVALVAIARWADPDGYNWTGFERVRQMCEISERPCQRAIARLVEAGKLARLVGVGAGHPTLYRVLVGQPDGAGDPEVMLAWLRARTDPYLVSLYGKVVAAMAKGAPAPGLPEKGGADAGVKRGRQRRPKGGASDEEKGAPATVQPAAIRNDLEFDPYPEPKGSGRGISDENGNGDHPPAVAEERPLTGGRLYRAYLDLCRERGGNPRWLPDKRSGGILQTACGEAAAMLASGAWTPRDVWLGMQDHQAGGLHASLLGSCIANRAAGGQPGGRAGPQVHPRSGLPLLTPGDQVGQARLQAALEAEHDRHAAAAAVNGHAREVAR
jgi:hypothetical protein